MSLCGLIAPEMYSSSICPETDVIFLFFWLLFYLFFSGILISITLKQRTYRLIDLTEEETLSNFFGPDTNNIFE